MNVKFTQKFLMAVLLGSGILRWLDWIDGTSLIKTKTKVRIDNNRTLYNKTKPY